MKYTVYPFSALVGQEELQLGLILNAINPAIGGILIRGEKGTAKSTAVRGLADLLPEIEVNYGCAYYCDPAQPDNFCIDCKKHKEELTSLTRKVQLINLPLNATEDRIVGGIDFSKAITSGETVLQPGLLARAHRSILYIDEVNLLDDHIVDLIVDAAASGKNIVEREGMSYSHPARFILIGTMNPEEGDLRPQLLDRFGFAVEVKGCEDIEQRIELLLRREAFDQDRDSFVKSYSEASREIRDRIEKARKILPDIRLSGHMRMFISELCTSNNVAGHRADLVIEQGALALAAYEGVHEVSNLHIAKIAPMALIHRTRDAEPPPPPPPPAEDEQPKEQQEEQENQDEEITEDKEHEQPPPQQAEGEEKQEDPQDKDSPSEDNQDNSNSQSEPPLTDQEGPEGEDLVFEVGEPFKIKKITSKKDRITRRGSGRRSRSRISQKQGRYIKASSSSAGNFHGDVALDATIRAAAPFQKSRKEQEQHTEKSTLAIHLKPSDIRVKIREKRIGNLLLFVVDGSGSMGARGRMTASKSAIMSLLLDAYQKRDKVSMISFRRKEAHINLPITNSVELAGKMLAEMPVGGRTPLSAGLVKSYELVRNYLVREPAGRPIVIFLTDGKTNVSLGEEKPLQEMIRLATLMSQEKRTQYIVVDTEEDGLVTFDLARKLAAALGAEYFKTKDLRAEELVGIIREKQ